MDKDVKQLNEEDINEKIKLFLQNPDEYNVILTSLLLNPSTVDLTIFKKNIDLIASKLLLITKEKSVDTYQALSCIYGAFLGDAMGSYCEFLKYNPENYKQIFVGLNNFSFEAGQITDDSEMALSMVFAIMDSPNPKELDQSLLYFYYGLWRSTGPFDIGRTTSSALRYFDLKTTNIARNAYADKKKIIAAATGGSLSNGFLMRISPFVVWFYYVNKPLVKEVIGNSTYSKEDYQKLYRLIKDTVKLDNQMTHWDPEVHSASAVFIFMALTSLIGLPPKEILLKLSLLISDESIFSQTYDKTIKEHVEKALKEFSHESFKVEEYMKVVSEQHIGYYLHGFNLTLYYLYFFESIKPYTQSTTIYRQIMNEINNWGGDTDTNAAIVGAVIGPIIGFTNFGLNDLTVFLKHFSQRRFAYSSAFIYFYIQYLESPDFALKSTGVKFNFIRLLLTMLNVEMKN